MDQRNISAMYENQTCGITKVTTPGYCPETFDTELCWPETAPGTTANQSCPSNIGYDTNRLAFKECWDNGTWYTNRENKTWTNYTQCVDLEELNFLVFINELNVIGYSISLVALLISLWIFLAFRSLRCTRIRIHVQLFVSFILNNISFLLWYELVVPDIEVTIENVWWCQVLHVAKEYFMVANYMWMFCEALHLHLALVVVFVREERTMRWFYLIGWGMSALIVKLQSFVRIYVLKDTDLCWMNGSHLSTWFITIPVLITLILSTLFLVNVLRVILTVMGRQTPNPTVTSIRRAARAVLILTPLFGLHYILLPIRPDDTHAFFRLYLYMTAVIIPYQGLACAILFCFANQDVHQAINRGFYQRFARHSNRWSHYRYTGPVDSGGVYVVNGNGHSTNMALLSFNRRSTQSVRL